VRSGTSVVTAIGVETLVQQTWHLGQPLAESGGAWLWGLIAGVAAWRAKSVWPIIAAHWLLNVLIDGVALYHAS
jgi:membrane protease YdiL (CAAX protease family)